MAATNAKTLFVDTNVLIYATDPQSPFQPIADQLLEQAYTTDLVMALSPQVLREYLAVAARASSAGGRMQLADALENVESFRSAMHILEEGSASLDQLTELLHQIPTAGRRVHDANIVATMLAHGIQRLVTHNTADFARFAHLIEIVPLVPPTTLAE